MHIEWLLSQLEPKMDAIGALRRDGSKVDFFCYSSGSPSQPPSLPRALRQRAAALGIDVEIDHYCTL
jgi:hypothetical protein